MLPIQYIHLLLLNLLHRLSLRAIAVGNALILGLDLRDDAIQVQGEDVVHGQDHGHI